MSEIAKGWFGNQGRQQREGGDPIVNSKGFYGEVPGVCALDCKQQQEKKAWPKRAAMWTFCRGSSQLVYSQRRSADGDLGE